jgi:hypothetical protein
MEFPYTFRLIKGTHDWAYIGVMIALTMFAYVCYIFPIKPVFAEAPIKDTRVHELYCQGNKVCVPLDQFEIDFPESEKEKALEVLKSVCLSRNQTKDCYKILYGMAMTESRMNAFALGDSSMSLGFFQIHKGYHPNVPDSCRTSLRCSAEWTLDRMIRYGFEKNTDVAIMRHNGTPNTHKTLAYLSEVKKYANLDK